MVVDNDHLESARAIVAEFAAATTIAVVYCVEPRQSAVPAYALALPLLLVVAPHVCMRYLIKECDHLGRILALLAGKRMDRLLLDG